MPRFFINEVGTVREASRLFVNDSNVVRELTRLWALDGNTPRLVFELVQGLPPVPGPLVNGMMNTQENCISQWNIPEGSIVAIPSDFWAWSDDTTVPGLCVDVANVTIINQGNIIGRGGNGGGNPGGDGGPALEITACGVTIINSSGAFIAGGGGGGGFRVTNLGRGWSAGGGGGAGGGNGGGGSGGAGGAGGAIGAAGSGGSEAGGDRSLAQQAGGAGGGRILPGAAGPQGFGGAGGQPGTDGGGGGWGADGGTVSTDTRVGGRGGAGGPAIISSRIWNGVTDSGTIFGQVAPLIGSAVPIGRLFHHQQVTLSSLCVNEGDTFTIPENFFFWSDDISTAALTIDVPNVTIINNGSIIGRGGDGGGGSGVGQNGGPAIQVNAAGVTLQNNTSGFISGGGGGGRGRIVNRGRGTSNGGGGGAGGGFGGAGSSSNSRATTAIPGAIGQPGISGAETGGGGDSGTNYGAGGGRVTPGAAYTAVAGGGGGWGEPGLDTNGNEHTTGGFAIQGQDLTIINNGDIRGSNNITLLSGAVNGGDRGATADITPATVPTFPVGATAVFSNNSSGTSNPLKTAILRFDGVEVARFSSGAGGTPGSFCRTDGAATSTPITLTGGPYTPTTITLQVTGAASTRPDLAAMCPANISSSVTVFG